MTAVANGIHSISIILFYPARPCRLATGSIVNRGGALAVGGRAACHSTVRIVDFRRTPHCPLSNALREVAFAVAIGGKADIAFCGANVSF